MKTECPACNRRLSIEMNHIDKMVQCECGHEFLCRPIKDESKVKINAISNGVVLTGIDIPFSEMVGFIVKLSLASIPAAIIVSAIGIAVMAVFSILASMYNGFVHS